MPVLGTIRLEGKEGEVEKGEHEKLQVKVHDETRRPCASAWARMAWCLAPGIYEHAGARHTHAVGGEYQASRSNCDVALTTTRK